MAYPVIEDSTYGHTGPGSSLSITMPSSVIYNEYIIGFIASENAVASSIASSSGNFYLTSSISNSYSTLHLTCFFGKAKGGSNDNLTINFSTSNTIYYIVYRISGHGMNSALDFNWNYAGTVYHSSDFPMKGLAVADSGDKLYITALTYSKGFTSLSAPTGWGSLINNNYNGTESDNAAGIATAIVQSTSTTIIDNTWAYSTHDTQTSVSISVRIKPGSLPEVTSTGFGIIVPNGRIGRV